MGAGDAVAAPGLLDASRSGGGPLFNFFISPHRISRFWAGVNLFFVQMSNMRILEGLGHIKKLPMAVDNSAVFGRLRVDIM